MTENEETNDNGYNPGPDARNFLKQVAGEVCREVMKETASRLGKELADKITIETMARLDSTLMPTLNAYLGDHKRNVGRVSEADDIVRAYIRHEKIADRIKKAFEMRLISFGLKVEAMADYYGLPRTTLYAHLSEMGINLSELKNEKRKRAFDTYFERNGERAELDIDKIHRGAK